MSQHFDEVHEGKNIAHKNRAAKIALLLEYGDGVRIVGH